MGELKDEARIGRDAEGEFIGEVLGDIEGDKAINADRLMRRGEGAKRGMERQCLTSETVEAVLDGARGEA